MAHHTVLRPDRQALHVPAADQALPGGRLVESAVRAQGLHGPRELGRGGDVTASQAAGREDRGDEADPLRVAGSGEQHVVPRSDAEASEHGADLPGAEDPDRGHAATWPVSASRSLTMGTTFPP